MKTNLNILDTKIVITANEELSSWVSHDYSYYVVDNLDKPDLQFHLRTEKFDYSTLPRVSATTYHDDYIVYDNKNIRIIDFIGDGISIYDTKKNIINIYASDPHILYDIFYLSFESLLGEWLDRGGYHRIHCLSLDQGGKASLLLLPPGAGKTTLALKFSDQENIKVLSEDMVAYKDKLLHGLHFRWGIRDLNSEYEGRIIKRQKYQDKKLVSPTNFSISASAKPFQIILGQRVLGKKSKIQRVSKFSVIIPLFKSMVLGLELQQSLAYFLLRNYKDIFIKIRFTLGRLWSMFHVIFSSQTYIFQINNNQEENFHVLKDFLSKNK